MLFVSCRACDRKVPIEGPVETALRERFSLDSGAPETEVAENLRRGKRRLVCTACGDRRAEVEVLAERDCERCGAPIPWQRLEAIPDAAYCVPCQESAEVATEPAAKEDLGNCPRCGAPLETYQRKKPGATSYFVGCSAYPTCRYKPRR